MVDGFLLGWKNFIAYNLVGQRFHGVGLGPDTVGVRIDLYDSSGDYEASGIDGLEMHIHGNAQDQLVQTMKAGKLVVHGDVGQTFMYGAKGGEVYIRGSAAGRPLINAVGKPRVVINGTCLDYLAESFMAGNPLEGGGFVILNGLQFDDFGGHSPRKRPFPGSNLFSLASGGAIYIHFHPLTDADWALIKPEPGHRGPDYQAQRSPGRVFRGTNGGRRRATFGDDQARTASRKPSLRPASISR